MSDLTGSHPLINVVQDLSDKIQRDREDYERMHSALTEIEKVEHKARDREALKMMVILGGLTVDVLEREKAAFDAADLTLQENERLKTAMHAMIDELQSDVGALPSSEETKTIYSKILDWRQAIGTKTST